jgi:hypothetical protein
MEKYRGKHMAEALLGQAHLCDRIAAECSDEDTAKKYQMLARECRDAAVMYDDDKPQ